jgi:D-arabinose 1-dehydrogenase-like Zn-dependent alcohol dehydrogenase
MNVRLSRRTATLAGIGPAEKNSAGEAWPFLATPGLEDFAMRGVVFLGDRKLTLAEFPDPSPGSDDVIIGIRASGMCGSDLHAYRAPGNQAVPVIAGHEPAGEVVACGASVAGNVARVGQRVMVHHYHGCTTCRHCRTGWAQLCKAVPPEIYGINAHGSHARWLRVPADTLVPLDEALSFPAGAAISCGTGTAWGALRRMQLAAGDTLAIFGQGPVGLSATMLAAAQGARVLALDREPERLARAREFGAHAVMDVRAGGVVEGIRDATSGQGVTKALETSGSSDAIADALASVDTWGTVCFVGLGSEVRFDVRRILPTQITILTSWSMSMAGLRECADFIVQRNLKIDRLFTESWRLEDAAEAYRQFDRQVSGKGVFVM